MELGYSRCSTFDRLLALEEEACGSLRLPVQSEMIYFITKSVFFVGKMEQICVVVRGRLIYNSQAIT